MTHSTHAFRSWLRLLALLLLLPVLLPQRAWAAQTGEERLTTKYFTIYYPNGEKKTADWYASFADDVNVSVSELLGAPPVEGLTLRIYASESEYAEANPLAELHPGILAHAIPEQKEIGVAVERLRQAPTELARESFRHEMTHIVAGALSGQNMPIGFQEGLAQYNELSSRRAEEVAQVLREAESAGAMKLTLSNLNDMRIFRRNIDLAYPLSYTMMAFLAEHYGMGKFARFVEELSMGDGYQQAFLTTYDKSLEEVEVEWRTFLPGFIKEGWKTNVLASYDLGPGIAMYNAGQYNQARDFFVQSEKLYRDLNRSDRAAEAAAYVTRTEKAATAGLSLDSAQKALESHDYLTAQKNADDAAQVFSELNLAEQQQRAAGMSQQAKSGIAGVAALERAQSYLQALNIPVAREEARKAGEALAPLGDATRVAEANKILNDMWSWQRLAGLAALAAGALSVLAGAFAVLRSRRRLTPAQRPILIEESTSWL